MKQHYYQIVDFDSQESYYSSKKEAEKHLRKLIKEAQDGGWEVDLIDFRQFDVAKMPKRKMIINLLHQVQFMANVVELDIEKYK